MIDGYACNYLHVETVPSSETIKQLLVLVVVHSSLVSRKIWLEDWEEHPFGSLL
jgi:hypothetical protein